MAFRVELSKKAKNDLDGVLEWLQAEHAGNPGLRWYARLEDAISSLAEHPRRCPLAPENADALVEVRQLVFGRKPHYYRVLFSVQGEMVVVLHIRHGRRERASDLGV